jgi:hypothetical protein
MESTIAFDWPEFDASDPTLGAISVALTRVCGETNWDYGEAWTHHPVFPVLELSRVWAVKPQLAASRSLAWAQFQRCSQDFLIRPGEGLPGRVWLSQQAEWMVDTAAESETYFLRNQIAKAFDVRAGFGLPMPLGGDRRAVLVFFKSAANLPDVQLIQQTGAIVHGSC